jgi:hypothetical protein
MSFLVFFLGKQTAGGCAVDISAVVGCSMLVFHLYQGHRLYSMLLSFCHILTVFRGVLSLGIAVVVVV